MSDNHPHGLSIKVSALSLRTNSLVQLSAFFLILAVAVSAACGYFILGTFSRAEEDTARENLYRGGLALQRLGERLSSTARDWSAWNDTYDYMLGKNPTYPENNLDSEAIKTIAVDLLVLLKNDGNLKIAAEATNAKVLYPEVEFFQKETAFLRLDEKSPITRGLARAGNKVITFVASPVLTSKGTGPKAGLLLLVKVVDEAALAEFSENIGAKITFEAESGAAEERIDKNGDIITASRPLLDYSGKPIGRLTVAESRKLYISGVVASKIAVVAIAITFLIGLLAISFVFDRNVLRRLSSLTDSLPGLMSSEYRYAKAEIKTADEITILGHRLRQLVSEKNRLFEDLTKADDEVKSLTELLPVCAWCKQVRDDSGYWHKVDAYLKTHMKREITHGICPTCMDNMEGLGSSGAENTDSVERIVGGKAGLPTHGRRGDRKTRPDSNSYELLRRFPRIEAQYLIHMAEVGAEHLQSIGHTLTIGGGGCQLFVDTDVDPDSLLALTFEIEGKMIGAKARVVWKTKMNNHAYELGVEFIDIDSKDHRRLSEFISRQLYRS